ncbi:MAG TPA: cupin domain-containing protein [Acetobacteraceae bacterium]|jgi:quercetin dioxygenase-like cupin family protein|nr:cupin domain-containing protein [Acetobacteraceae bacterium]
MERSKFEAELQRDGYKIVVNTMQPDAINPEHAHDFDARLLVVAGEMTVVVGDQRSTYQVGDTFNMTHGCRHAEHAGPQGATYVAGRRTPN